MSQRILTDFSKRHTELFGRHTVDLGHALAGSPLFTDDALAALIDKAPAGSYHVTTMDATTQDPRTRREGVVDGLSGAQAMEAVRRGHIAILLHGPGRYDTRYDELLAAIYRELGELMPDFKSRGQRLSILISSPRMQIPYHAEAPGQVLWQVRGYKRVLVYPASAPFLPQEALERIALGDPAAPSLDYEPWFDEYAAVIDLAPGRMLHWPANSPCRIVNADCLNVAFTTEHWTDVLRQGWAVSCANGILRGRLGLRSLSRPSAGAGLWARVGLAAAWQAAAARRRARKLRIDFKVDLDAPWCVRPIQPFELSR